MDARYFRIMITTNLKDFVVMSRQARKNDIVIIDYVEKKLEWI